MQGRVTRYLSLGLDMACIADAREHIAAALSPPVSLEEQLLAAETQLKQLQEELAASKQTAAGLQEHVQSLQIRLVDVRENEAKLAAEGSLAERRLEEQEKDLAASKAELEDLKQQVGTLQAQLPGWEEVHIADLQIQQQMQSAELSYHANTSTYFPYVRQRHLQLIYDRDEDYAHRFGYVVGEGGQLTRQDGTQVYLVSHTSVIQR